MPINAVSLFPINSNISMPEGKRTISKIIICNRDSPNVISNCVQGFGLEIIDKLLVRIVGWSIGGVFHPSIHPSIHLFSEPFGLFQSFLIYLELWGHTLSTLDVCQKCLFICWNSYSCYLLPCSIHCKPIKTLKSKWCDCMNGYVFCFVSSLSDLVPLSYPPIVFTRWFNQLRDRHR